MAGSTIEHDTLEHAGPAISPEYYPAYAGTTPRVTTLYSTPLYMGSVILLVAMSLLGLPLIAFAHWADGTVSLTVALVATAVFLVVFLVGLFTCIYAFRKYAGPEED